MASTFVPKPSSIVAAEIATSEAAAIPVKVRIGFPPFATIAKAPFNIRRSSSCIRRRDRFAFPVFVFCCEKSCRSRLRIRKGGICEFSPNIHYMEVAAFPGHQKLNATCVNRTKYSTKIRYPAHLRKEPARSWVKMVEFSCCSTCAEGDDSLNSTAVRRYFSPQNTVSRKLSVDFRRNFDYREMEYLEKIRKNVFTCRDGTNACREALHSHLSDLLCYAP